MSASADTPEFSFQVIEVLASGTYGTVVVARPVDDDRRVVVKVLRKELLGQPEALARTRDEARLLHRLRHPNIVAVERLTEHEGRPIVVMEFIDGLDLGTLTAAISGGLPAAEALEIVRQVATALDAAWTEPPERPLRVVHRDIKPGNILLSTEGEVKVVDFGLARADFDDREADTAVQILGSLAFAAPERHDSTVTTPAVDVYALGVTLIHLLTGRNLVLPRSRHRHDGELLRQLSHVAPIGLTEAQRTEVRGIVVDMCSYDPSARPSASEVATRLAAYLERHGAAPNLKRLAQERVQTGRARRKRLQPKDHPDWLQVAFLDEGSREDGAPQPIRTGSIDRILALFKRN